MPSVWVIKKNMVEGFPVQENSSRVWIRSGYFPEGGEDIHQGTNWRTHGSRRNDARPVNYGRNSQSSFEVISLATCKKDKKPVNHWLNLIHKLNPFFFFFFCLLGRNCFWSQQQVSDAPKKGPLFPPCAHISLCPPWSDTNIDRVFFSIPRSLMSCRISPTAKCISFTWSPYNPGAKTWKFTILLSVQRSIKRTRCTDARNDLAHATTHFFLFVCLFSFFAQKYSPLLDLLGRWVKGMCGWVKGKYRKNGSLAWWMKAFASCNMSPANFSRFIGCCFTVLL